MTREEFTKGSNSRSLLETPQQPPLFTWTDGSQASRLTCLVTQFTIAHEVPTFQLFHILEYTTFPLKISSYQNTLHNSTIIKDLSKMLYPTSINWFTLMGENTHYKFVSMDSLDWAFQDHFKFQFKSIYCTATFTIYQNEHTHTHTHTHTHRHTPYGGGVLI